MQEKIGNVTLDYEYYPGEDLSDGPVEERTSIAKIIREKELNQLIYERNSWPVLYHFHIFIEHSEWLPITKEQKVWKSGPMWTDHRSSRRKPKCHLYRSVEKCAAPSNAYRNRE